MHIADATTHASDWKNRDRTYETKNGEGTIFYSTWKEMIEI